MKDRTGGQRCRCAPAERKKASRRLLGRSLTGVLVLLMALGSVASGQDEAVPDKAKEKNTKENSNGGQGEQEGLGSDQSGETTGRTVITATRIDTPIEQAGSSITVIESQDIKNRQELLVGSSLRFSPGVDIRTSGAAGSITSIFTRGTDSDHTLLMVDGIRLQDPSGPTTAPFLDHLTVDNVDRIEVLRGPQSTLYGSDAIGGVVNLISAKGKGDPSYFFSAEGGSHYTAAERFSMQAGFEHFNYSFSASYFDTKGISSAVNDSEHDPYRNTSVAGRIEFDPTDQFGVDLFVRYIDAHKEVDAGADPDISDSSSEIMLFKVQPHFMVIEDVWEQKLSMWVTDIERKDDGVSFSLPGTRKATVYGVDWQNNIMLDAWEQVVTFGIEYREEEVDSQPAFGSFEGRTRNVGFYLRDQFHPSDELTLTAGVRLDDHDDFGTETTYRFTGAYELPDSGTIFRASYGTGFKAPSLVELFDTTFLGNNPNLDPETSRGFDVGIEQPLDEDSLTLGATYFYNDIDDMIVAVFDPGSGNFVNTNVEQVQTQGLEFFARWKPCECFIAQYSYTYTDTKAIDAASFGIGDNSRLLRRPLHKAAVDLTWLSEDKRNQLTLGMLYVGVRDDLDSTFATVEADDYFVASISGRMRLTDNIDLFARVENVFDEEYEDVLGFKMPRIAAYGGLSFHF
jgi:vitamin B12 transporter